MASTKLASVLFAGLLFCCFTPCGGEEPIYSYTAGLSDIRPYEISTSVSKQIAAAGIEPSALAGLRAPAEFQVNWAVVGKGALPPEVSSSGGGVTISCGGMLPLFARTPIPVADMREYIAEYEISGKGELVLGAYGYGTDSYPNALETHKLDSAEPVTFRVPLGFKLPVDQFRPVLGVNGNVHVSKFVIYAAAVRPGSVVEGELLEVSKLPDPATADYPDCNYTAKFRGHQIVRGESVPCDINLVLPGFRNRELSRAAAFKPGDQIRVKLVAFGALPPAGQQISQADDLQLLELESFSAEDAIPVSRYASIDRTVPFRGPQDQVTSIFDLKINPPVSANAAAAKEAAVRRDLNALQIKLAALGVAEDELNRDFSEIWSSRRQGLARLPDTDLFWGAADGAFFALPGEYALLRPQPLPEEKVRAITALKDFCEANGVQLIIQVIPDMYALSARVLNPEFRRVADIRSAEAAKQLLEQGVEAVYTMDDLLRGYGEFEFTFCYPANGHPAEGCQQILTRQAAQRLARYGLAADPAAKFTSARLPMYGDMAYPSGVDVGSHHAGEPILCRHVMNNGQAIASDPKSPVLVIGNSFIQTPMPADTYGAYLAEKIGFVPHIFQVSGDDSIDVIVFELSRNPRLYLSGKKAVILPISAAFLLCDKPFVNLRTLDENRRGAVLPQKPEQK